MEKIWWCEHTWEEKKEKIKKENELRDTDRLALQKTVPLGDKPATWSVARSGATKARNKKILTRTKPECDLVKTLTALAKYFTPKMTPIHQSVS